LIRRPFRFGLKSPARKGVRVRVSAPAPFVFNNPQQSVDPV
jgi:hypothetical protein